MIRFVHTKKNWVEGLARNKSTTANTSSKALIACGSASTARCSCVCCGVCMHACVYTYVCCGRCVCMHHGVYMYVCVVVCVCMHVYICMYICCGVCMHAYVQHGRVGAALLCYVTVTHGKRKASRSLYLAGVDRPPQPQLSSQQCVAAAARGRATKLI